MTCTTPRQRKDLLDKMIVHSVTYFPKGKRYTGDPKEFIPGGKAMAQYPDGRISD